MGESALLVEYEEPLDLLAALHTTPAPGQLDVVPAERTVLVVVDDGTDLDQVEAHLRSLQVDGGAQASAALVEIEVDYHGPDLEALAGSLGLTVESLIQRHTAAEWVVSFIGFAPGFAYLTSLAWDLDVPRLAHPRTSVPPGSVAVAHRYSGVYPRASPGGWQLLGTTDRDLWDPARTPPALLTPGTRVRYRRRAIGSGPALRADPPFTQPPTPNGPALVVVRPGILCTVQDLGRPGLGSLGVSRSGAADRSSLRLANRLVGNPEGTAALEFTLGGGVLRARGELRIAVTGPTVELSVRRGTSWEPAGGRTLTVADGDEVRLRTPGVGLRNYLAVAGGIAVPAVLGSRSRDLLSGIGPPIVAPGQILPIGTGCPAVDQSGAAAAATENPAENPAEDGPIQLSVVLGPRQNLFTDDAVALLFGQDWLVTPESNRIGLRLSGALPLERADPRERASEPMVPGALQVPPSGQPVLFGPDHPSSGGYPVIGVLTGAAQDLAGQARPGAVLRFTPASRPCA